MPHYHYQDNPEYRKAMQVASRIRWDDHAFRSKMSLINQAVGMRPEQRQQRKERALRLWQDPVYVEKQQKAHQEQRRVKTVQEAAFGRNR